MKNKTVLSLLLAASLSLIFTGCMEIPQASEDAEVSYQEGYNTGYSEGYLAGQSSVEAAGTNTGMIARFSGEFTVTVEKLLPDYHALPGNTIAVVHFFQDAPFLIHFQEDMTGKLEEGETYVFEFEPFETVIPDSEEHPQIMNYMYQIHVTDYRVAEEDETGLAGRQETVEIIQGKNG